MKNNFGLLEADLQTIIAVLKQFATVEKATIFGSRAKGNYKKGSDIDIALIGAQLNFDTISQISYQLNEETQLPYQLDILNYHTIIEPALKEHIDRAGIVVYENV